MSTKEKIIDAAEILFSDLGFDNTSLRAITSEANVNLASVNYHFGSKKELIQAVLERYLSVLMPGVDGAITKLTDGHSQPTVKQFFSSMVDPILRLDEVRPNGSKTFIQLFAKAYYESQGHLRKYTTEHYGDILERFSLTLHATVPHLPEKEVFWRWHFAMGSCVFTMASGKALSDMAAADYHQQMSLRELIEKVIDYIAAGFDAPNNDNLKLTSRQDMAM